jgi:hypothetical protein
LGAEENLLKSDSWRWCLRSKTALAACCHRFGSVEQPLLFSQAWWTAYAATRSDEQLMLPTRSDEQQMLPAWSDEQQMLPARSDEQQMLPARSDEQQMLPARSDEQQSLFSRTVGTALAVAADVVGS